jgi:hypothetical protein
MGGEDKKLSNKAEAINAVLVFTLADCRECGARYAVTPDPNFPGQWVFFGREHKMIHPTHICVGGMLCVQGHSLEITAQSAVLTNEGDWLSLVDPEFEVALN